MNEKHLTCTKYLRRGQEVLEVEVEIVGARYFFEGKKYKIKTGLEITSDFIKDKIYETREAAQYRIDLDNLNLWIWQTFRDLKYWKDFEKLKKIKEIWDS